MGGPEIIVCVHPRGIVDSGLFSLSLPLSLSLSLSRSLSLSLGILAYVVSSLVQTHSPSSPSNMLNSAQSNGTA
jgi:hypothetical protein